MRNTHLERWACLGVETYNIAPRKVGTRRLNLLFAIYNDDAPTNAGCGQRGYGVVIYCCYKTHYPWFDLWSSGRNYFAKLGNNSQFIALVERNFTLSEQFIDYFDNSAWLTLDASNDILNRATLLADKSQHIGCAKRGIMNLNKRLNRLK